MSQAEFQIKIGVAAQIEQLRAMEAQFTRQIVQLRALGDTGSVALKKVESNLALVRGELGKIGTLSKANAVLGDTLKTIPVVGTAMNVLNGSAAAVGVGLGAVTYAVTQFRASLNFADNLQDVSEQLNVSASSLQTLNAHFADAGVKAPQVAQTMQRLQASLALAAAGSEPLQKAFAALGLSIQSLRALSPDQQIAAVGAALARHAGSATAAAAAQEILGRGTGRLINSLKELGTAGLEKTKTSMIATGRVIEDSMVKKLADANQKLEELDQRWTIFKATIAAGLLPGRAEGPQGRAQNDRARIARANSPAVPLENQPLMRVFTAEEIARADTLRGREGHETVTASRMKESNRRAELNNAPILAARAKASEDRARAEAARLVEAKRLDTAKQTTAELAKQAPEVTKALAAAQFALAADQAKLSLLDGQAEVEQRRYEQQLAAAQLAGDDLAANQAEQALSLALLNIEKERRAVVASIADAAEKERVEKERIAKTEEAAARKRQALEAQALADRIAEGNASIAAIEDNQLIPRREKDRLKISLLKEQNAEITAQILKLKQLDAADPKGPDASRQAQIAGLQGKLVANDSALEGLRPKDTGESVRGVLTAQMEEVGTGAENAAKIVSTTLGSAVNGISASMQGLINGTMSWASALQNIGSTIMNSIIGAIADMFAEWIVGRAAAGVASMAWSAKEGAADTAAKAPGALLTSISSWGIAAAVGLAALVGVMAAVGGFAEGGKVTGPGTGTSDSILTRLSNGEYVINAAAASAIGYDTLDALNEGRTPATTAPLAASGGGGGNVVVHNHFGSGVTRAEVAALIPEIERRTLAAVNDRSRRGKA
jgi:hypothetical protein